MDERASGRPPTASRACAQLRSALLDSIGDNRPAIAASFRTLVYMSPPDWRGGRGGAPPPSGPPLPLPPPQPLVECHCGRLGIFLFQWLTVRQCRLHYQFYRLNFFTLWGAPFVAKSNNSKERHTALVSVCNLISRLILHKASPRLSLLWEISDSG